MSGQLPPANWYPDPSDPGRERYWDGTQWTNETREIHDTPPPPQGPPPGQTFAPPPSAGAPAPAPAYVSGPVPQGPSAPPGMSTTAKVLIALGVVTAVLLGGCVALLAVARTAVEDAADEQASNFVAEVEEAPDETTEATIDEGSELVDDGADGLEAGDQSADSGPGTRQDPLAYDQTVTLTWDTFGDADGSVWETTIGRPADIGSDIMAANEFNAEPPEGVVFAGFPVTMTLVEAGKEPLSTGFNFTWEILGGVTAAAYDSFTIETESFGCGVVPDEFGDFDEVFVGGTLSGTVCIPIPAQDLDHPDTQTALHFGATDSRIVFGE